MSAYDRVRRTGLQSAAALDLLSVIVSRRPDDAEDHQSAARAIMKRYGMGRLLDLSPADLREDCGLDDFEATRILAAIELGRRACGAGGGERDAIETPEDAYALFAWLEGEKQERLCAAFLDAKAGLIAERTIHIGTLSASPVGAREIFREAVREGAASIVVAHNHPSGDPTPSPQDFEATQALVDAGMLLDVHVLDHIVVGRGRYTSMRRLGGIEWTPDGTKS